MKKPLMVKRDDHYELHYPDHVEFWTLDLSRKIAADSKVEQGST